MARNVEIKARLTNWDRTLELIQGLCPHHQNLLVQTDTFFNCTSGRLKLRQFDDGSAELIYYTRSNQTGAKLSEYFRTPCPDGAAMKRILADSIGIRGIIEKRRELFLVGQTRIHLDRVNGLGQFLELEVVLDENETLEFGQSIADHLIDRLEIPKSDFISNAYIDLMEDQAQFSDTN